MLGFNRGEKIFNITNKSDSPIRYEYKKLQVLDYDYSFISVSYTHLTLPTNRLV